MPNTFIFFNKLNDWGAAKLVDLRSIVINFAVISQTQLQVLVVL